MNEIRVPDLLQQRYNTHFLGLVHKLSRPVLGKPCCYSNNLASKPLNNNNNMHRPLKLKLQNALNQVIFADAEARGLFIGGRRRNRKKRKNRNGKDKKKQKKQDAKSSPVLVKCNSESISYIGDDRPLIESDYGSSYSLTYTDYIDCVDDLPPLIDIENEENVNPDTMPFDFFKKSDKKEEKQSKKQPDSKEEETPKVEEKQKVEEAPKEKENQKVEERPKEEEKLEVEETTKEEEKHKDEEIPKEEAEEKPKEGEKKPEQDIAEQEEQKPETTNEMSEEQQNVEKQEQAESEAALEEKITDEIVEAAVDAAIAEEVVAEAVAAEIAEDIAMTEKPTSNGTSGTESSPLIEKNAVKDTQPGFLCCTIL